MVKEGADQRCFLGFGASKLQGQQHSSYGGEVPEDVAQEKNPCTHVWFRKTKQTHKAWKMHKLGTLQKNTLWKNTILKSKSEGSWS